MVMVSKTFEKESRTKAKEIQQNSFKMQTLMKSLEETNPLLAVSLIKQPDKSANIAARLVEFKILVGVIKKNPFNTAAHLNQDIGPCLVRDLYQEVYSKLYERHD